jgi:predicted transcriptional regulator of viral defense system
MKKLELDKINKLFLSIKDIANILSISKESAKVTASRYADKGYLLRLKRDFYITENKFENLNEQELFRLANILQTPSYVSLTTALSYYNISTQQQRNYIESIALKRTKQFQVKKTDFHFILVKKEFYYGFVLTDNFFIATPEKALADAVYLTSLKRYNCDFDAVDFKKIDKKKIGNFILKTNLRTQKLWASLCKIYKI